MKWLSRLLSATVAAIAFTACSAGVGGYTPAMNTHMAIAKAKSQSDRVVYVADLGSHSLIVYPYGVKNPSPITSIQYTTGPSDVTLDNQGRVAVTHDSEVSILDPGTLQAIETIPLRTPRGICFDKSGNLFVNEQSADGQSEAIDEYGAGNYAFIKAFPLPSNVSPIGGVAVDSHETVLTSALINGQLGAAFIEVAPNAHEVWNMGGPGGVTVSPEDVPVSGALSALFYYYSLTVPPKRVFVNMTKYGNGITNLHFNADGDLAVPMSNSGTVAILPAKASSEPYVIKTGLSKPAGAVVGM